MLEVPIIHPRRNVPISRDTVGRRKAPSNHHHMSYRSTLRRRPLVLRWNARWRLLPWWVWGECARKPYPQIQLANVPWKKSKKAFPFLHGKTTQTRGGFMFDVRLLLQPVQSVAAQRRSHPLKFTVFEGTDREWSKPRKKKRKERMRTVGNDFLLWPKKKSILCDFWCGHNALMSGRWAPQSAQRSGETKWPNCGILLC